MAGKSQVDKLVLHLVATICTLSIVELASSTSDRGFARKLTYSGDVPVNYSIAAPTLYNITYHLTAENFLGNSNAAQDTYTAQSYMFLDIFQTTSNVTFNSKDLNYSQISYTVGSGPGTCLCGTLSSCTTTNCSSVLTPSGPTGASEGLYTLAFNSTVNPGDDVIVFFAFNGSLANGLARSSAFNYTDPATNTTNSQVLIAAHLEPEGARTMLPCFDAPSFKANFSMNLQVPSDLIALSNTPEYRSQSGLEPGTTLHVFETTPMMATYLIGVTVGHMVSTSAISDSGRNISIWSVPALGDQHAVPLQAALRGTNYYERYTGIELPLKKLDFMAIPGLGGAVENWGLLQFDERRMLVNEATEGAYGRWLSADVVCHELAHQWFGDCVTCTDFDNIVVNEGIASFMEYKCINASFPEMSGPALFQRATSPDGENIGVHEGPRETALMADASPYIEALLFAYTPDNFLSYYPAIPYSKGASVLGMLQAYWDSAGPDAFQEGLRTLLTRHALSSATLDDVLLALLNGFATSVETTRSGALNQLKSNSTLFTDSDTEAVALLRTWITQPGYPLLIVSDTNAAGDIAVQQARFYAYGSNVRNDTYMIGNDSSWFVPLQVGPLESASSVPLRAGNLATAGSGNAGTKWAELLQKPEIMLNITGPVINKAATRFYRMQYPLAQQQQLIGTVANLSSSGNSTLPQLLQAHAFISDVLALSFAGNTDPSAILELGSAVATSQAASTGFGLFLLAQPVVNALQQLVLFAEASNNTCSSNLKQAVQQILTKIAAPVIAEEKNASGGGRKYESASYAVSQDTFLYDHVKGQVLLAAAQNGDADAATFLCALYANSTGSDMSRGEVIDPDLRGAAYQTALGRLGDCLSQSEADEAWQAMLTKWRTEPDIQEAERALYALPWSFNSSRLDQTLNLTFTNDDVVSRSPANIAAALLKNVASNNLGVQSTRHGSDFAWSWVERNFNAVNGSSIFTTLESLGFVPTQQNLDSLTAFLSPSGDGASAPVANRVRLLAKLQHNVHWVATNIVPDSLQSNLCATAEGMLMPGSAGGIVTAG